MSITGHDWSDLAAVAAASWRKVDMHYKNCIWL